MLRAMAPRRSSAHRRTILRRRAVALAVLITLAVTGAIANGSEEAGKPASTHRPARQGVLAAREERAPGAQRSQGKARPHGVLEPGSDPSVLPGPVLIADRDNNRLIEVSPAGRVLWRFPAPGDLAPGETFKLPDDAFFSPNGRDVVVTQEDDFVISVVDIARRRIVYRYGHPGVPGSEPGYVHNPDDAMMTPSGDILSADIKNCRVLVIRPPAHRPLRQLGVTGPLRARTGHILRQPQRSVSDEQRRYGGHGDQRGLAGRPLRRRQAGPRHSPARLHISVGHQRGRAPGLFLSVDYTSPGAIETFTADGTLRWRYQPTGQQALDQPSLALPLPNGDVLANDDKNDRVIVVDPRTNRIVWQYGHTHTPGAGEGFLSNPDGVDLAPPFSLADAVRRKLARALKSEESADGHAGMRFEREDRGLRAARAVTARDQYPSPSDARRRVRQRQRQAPGGRDGAVERVDREDRRGLAFGRGAAAAENVDVGAEASRPRRG